MGSESHPGSHSTLAYPATTTPSLHHELSVSLSTCDDYIHPDPHSLRRGSNHVVDPVVSLHTEGQGGVWTLMCILQVVVIHFFNSLEVDHSFQLGFMLVCKVGERTSVAVEDEPAFLPGFDLASHLDQVASAGLFRDGQVEACVCAVARRLNVSP